MYAIDLYDDARQMQLESIVNFVTIIYAICIGILLIICIYPIH